VARVLTQARSPLTCGRRGPGRASSSPAGRPDIQRPAADNDGVPLGRGVRSWFAGGAVVAAAVAVGAGLAQPWVSDPGSARTGVAAGPDDRLHAAHHDA
jgi:hypothetical protein